MSQENVELARQVLAALGRRDAERLIALSDPEVEWYSLFALGEEGGAYRGHAGARKYMSDLDDAWEIGRADVDYRGRGSGVEAETSVGWMLKFRDGKLVCFRAFREPERTLEAAGLRE